MCLINILIKMQDIQFPTPINLFMVTMLVENQS